MDGSAFDRFVRHIGEEASRRGLLRSAFAATVAGLGIASVLDSEDAAARSCKAKCRKKNNPDARRKCKRKCRKDKCASEGQFLRCTSDNQCCSSQNLVCDVPFGASSSDKNCCRGQGASCTPPDESGPKCCTGEAGTREFECVGGFCQECPEGLCE